MPVKETTETAPREPGTALRGKVVLVTGGARRVGRAISTELAGAGARVVVHCHQALAEATALAEGLGGGALALQADLRDGEAIAGLFAQVQAHCGGVDVLVNNAAGFERTPFLEMTDAQWDDMLALNLTAPRRCAQRAVRAGAWAIVNVLDVAAWQPWSGFGAYCVSKAGLLHLTRVLARELAPGVRVNGVAPGTVLFPVDYDEAARQQVLARVPLMREGEPADVARAVRFLLEEPYLTGVCLPVDGGQGLR